MAQRRVCITGVGVVSPLGRSLSDFDAMLFGGQSAVRAEPLLLPGADAVTVPLARCSFDAATVRAPSRQPLDRGSAMALAAGIDAAAAAGLQPELLEPERLGVFWGSGMGGAATFDATCRTLYAEQGRIRPTAVVTGMPNAPLAELALHFRARGMAMGYANACASAAIAIGEGLRALREGRLDVAIVGGSEALLSPGVIGAWNALRVLAPCVGDGSRACRPFAADRAGFALGEGAAALVLETPDHARRRGATWTFEMSGYGTTCDARHMTQPDAEGQLRAMRGALLDAGLQPADIGHVNSHGTATLAGDAAEAESLRALFGDAMPAVTSTKAIAGHLLGAGGALELVAALRALERGAAPPTGNVAQADPALAINLVTGSARPLPRFMHTMSNSFAFGGTNAVLVASLAA